MLSFEEYMYSFINLGGLLYGIYLAALIIFLTKKKDKREGKRNSTTFNCKQIKRNCKEHIFGMVG